MITKRTSPLKVLILLLTITTSTESCYHYRVLTTNSDPATEYQKKTLNSWMWGLVNSPKDFIVPNCKNNNSIDEVVFNTNVGYSLLTIFTLGIYCPVEVKWKCHKPCAREGDL